MDCRVQSMRQERHAIEAFMPYVERKGVRA